MEQTFTESERLHREQIISGRKMMDSQSPGNQAVETGKSYINKKKKYFPPKQRPKKILKAKPKARILKGQDLLLSNLMKEKATVVFRHVGGEETFGKIEEFDNYTVLARDEWNNLICIYKHSLVKFNKED